MAAVQKMSTAEAEKRFNAFGLSGHRLQKYAAAGAVILDTHVGSASSLIAYVFNGDRLLVGHGDKSAIIAAMLIPDLTDEEMLCIRYHHGAFEYSKDAWNAYGHAIEKYPNVLYTHTADMSASRISYSGMMRRIKSAR